MCRAHFRAETITIRSDTSECCLLNGTVGAKPDITDAASKQLVGITKFHVIFEPDLFECIDRQCDYSLQVEQHWLEESSNDSEGMTDTEACQDLATSDTGAKTNIDTTQSDVPKPTCAANVNATSQQKASQENQTAAAGQHDDHCGNGVTADAVDDGTEEGEVDEAYVMAYLGRHMCPQEVQSAHMSGAACGGTMTPVGVHGDTYVCNMCDFERSESERIAELSRTFQEVVEEAAA